MIPFFLHVGQFLSFHLAVSLDPPAHLWSGFPFRNEPFLGVNVILHPTWYNPFSFGLHISSGSSNSIKQSVVLLLGASQKYSSRIRSDNDSMKAYLVLNVCKTKGYWIIEINYDYLFCKLVVLPSHQPYDIVLCSFLSKDSLPYIHKECCIQLYI